MKATLFAGILLTSGFLVWKYDISSQTPGKDQNAVASSTATPAAPTVTVKPPASPKDNTRIQVALLLDTSNSMDGLIDQAKSRLWNIINVLTTLKYQGKTPDIEIALYEYGNDGLSSETGFIRQVTP